MNKKVDVSFHGTFPPTLRYISEIVKLASQNFSGTKEEISEITGIPTGEKTGKVVPHIKYAKFMNLITSSDMKDGKYTLELTELGQLIYQEDKFFIDKISKWLANYFLCDYSDGAPQWSFIFNKYNYTFESEYSMDNIEENARLYFEKNVKMSVLKNMYVIDYGFEDLNIIKEVNKNIVFKKCMMQQDALYVYGYTLLYSWEKYQNDKIELNIDDIVNDMRWGQKFGFDYNTTLEVLDELENLDIIKLNKQLKPMTIIKNASSEDIIGNIYDLAL